MCYSLHGCRPMLVTVTSWFDVWIWGLDKLLAFYCHFYHRNTHCLSHYFLNCWHTMKLHTTLIRMALSLFFMSTSLYISLFQYVNNQQPLPLLLLSTPPPHCLVWIKKFPALFYANALLSLSLPPLSTPPSFSLSLSLALLFWLSLLSCCAAFLLPWQKKGSERERDRVYEKCLIDRVMCEKRR